MNTKKNLVIDIVALLIYAAVANPALTGISIHEWISLGLLVVFFVHCVGHFDWIVEAIRGIISSPLTMRTGNLILALATLIVFMVVMVSGFGISGSVLAFLGLYADGYFFWNPLHSISAKILLALLLVHVVVHGKWLYTFLKKDKGNQHE